MLKVPHNDRTVQNLIDLPKMRLPGFKFTQTILQLSEIAVK